METVLVTGHAGFIGAAVAQRLLQAGYRVVGVDNFNDYYDPALKRARVASLAEFPGFSENRIDIADAAALRRVFIETRPDRVIHLAAQAGVRHSLKQPEAYVTSNLVGFANLLECCRHNPVKHLIYASSSSVYGNSKVPFAVDDRVDEPVSLYAATKRANELLACSYSHLYGIAATGFRFFTVYGPWGRPDMAYYEFTRRMLAGETIELFNHGNCRRDFTFIDDIVEGLMLALDETPADRKVPHALYNLGNDNPVALTEFVATLERLLGVKAKTRLAPPQLGDVEATWADIEATTKRFGWRPRTSLSQGLERFAAWYREYHQLRYPASA